MMFLQLGFVLLLLLLVLMLLLRLPVAINTAIMGLWNPCMDLMWFLLIIMSYGRLLQLDNLYLHPHHLLTEGFTFSVGMFDYVLISCFKGF